ncbi:cytochrome c3 family protein [Anaerolinea sp.]|uniref:cytochrome c3 family protein n=1 Tax=Anaerolinea sp. TaxID=1872519 RepID=UPI002ACE6B3A|nr:cytochrome c3 family protein [Anaerolinea sp.]
MSKKTIKLLLIATMIMVALFVLTACQASTPTAAPTQAPVPTCPAPEPCPVQPPAMEAPFEALWKASPHNDAEAEAFVHWNETEDKKIPVACAACHSTPGYLDFLGADGSEAGKVDQPADIGTTVTCNACHNDATAKLTSVKFPSGVEVTGLGAEARCMVCHQGRASKVQVDAQIEKFQATDPDVVVKPVKEGDTEVRFGFINIHYFAAAATLYGDEVKGGYEYDGKAYDFKNDHVEGYNTCVGCHNPHTTEVKVEECALCHEGVKTVEDLKNVRMISSAPDYDGDGDVKEGMAGEIEGLQTALYTAIQAYAKEVAGLAIVYDSAAYPYFFADADGDGKGDTSDKGPVAYSNWTPRLLKAAYNYQLSVKDPGAFAHGNKYIVQLLYDSIEDLNAKLSTPVDMSKMHRDDAGHFAGNTEAFRHWDAEEGKVPGACAKCHTATGLPQFLKEGTNITNHASNGFQCSTCHDEANWPARYEVNTVTFPSGAKLTFGEKVDANLCLLCHQGRESTVSVNNALKGLEEDTPSDKIRFRNVHYFAAGATLFGKDARGIYEYEGKEYAGQFTHEGNLNKCTDCHDSHTLEVKVAACTGCHGVDDPEKIRLSLKEDYDGDGDTTEGLAGEVETYREKLYAAIQAYAKDVAGVGIVYNPLAYPYFFADADGDGKADTSDKGPVAYASWTPRLLKAAYNYQYATKDPGGFAHNARYVLQALYDSITDLKAKVPSIDTTGLVRP